MIIQKEVKQIIKQLAVKYNKSEAEITKIVLSQFAFTHEMLTEGQKDMIDTFKNVHLKGLGTFYVNGKHVNYLKNLNLEKHNREL